MGGRRTSILSGQNLLRDPYQLALEDGLLWFYSENQGCHFWATHPEGDDPPVFSRVDHRLPWTLEGMALSEHLILACLFEAIACHAPYGANGMLDQNVIDEIAGIIPPLPIASWQWTQARFHAGGGAFMCVMGGEDGGWVWIGARTHEPLLFLRNYAVDWDYAAF
jgi:hypothetical protein